MAKISNMLNVICSLFSRLEQRAKTAKDSKDRTSLKKLQRQLKEVHEELQGYNTIMEKIQKSPERDWEGLVALGRASFSIGFFEHMENLVRAYHDDPAKRDGKPCYRLLNIFMLRGICACFMSVTSTPGTLIPKSRGLGQILWINWMWEVLLSCW